MRSDMRRRRLLQGLSVGATVPTLAQRATAQTSIGSQQWPFKSETTIRYPPTVADSTVYVASVSSLYAVDTADGAEKWRLTSGIDYNPPAVADGTAYVASGDYLSAVDTVDGTEQWRFDTESKISSSPTVSNGRVYIGCLNSVSAVDTADGTERWRFDPQGPSSDYHSPAVADGTVYIASVHGPLYAVDAISGSRKGRLIPQWTTLPKIVRLAGLLMFVPAGGILLLGISHLMSRIEADDTETPSPNPSHGEATVQTVLEDVDRTLNAAEEAASGDNIDLDDAVELYETAVESLSQIADRLSPSDDHYHQVQTTLAEAETAHERALQRRNRRTSLREQLAAAEADLATALEEHSQGNRTVARVRYRQARDRYDEALTEFDGGAMDPPLRIPPPADTRPPLETVAGVDQATADRLAETDRSIPSTIGEMEGIGQATARRLQAWAAIPCEGGLEIETAAHIERRRQLAVQHRQHCE